MKREILLIFVVLVFRMIFGYKVVTEGCGVALADDAYGMLGAKTISLLEAGREIAEWFAGISLVSDKRSEIWAIGKTLIGNLDIVDEDIVDENYDRDFGMYCVKAFVETHDFTLEIAILDVETVSETVKALRRFSIAAKNIKLGGNVISASSKRAHRIILTISKRFEKWVGKTVKMLNEVKPFLFLPVKFLGNLDDLADEISFIHLRIPECEKVRLLVRSIYCDEGEIDFNLSGR